MVNKISRLCLVLMLCGCSIALPAAEKAQHSVSISIDEKNIENRTGTRANFLPLIELIKVELFNYGFNVVDMAELGEAIEAQAQVNAVNGGEAASEVAFSGYKIRISMLKYGYSMWRQPNGSSRVSASVKMSANVIRVAPEKGRITARAIGRVMSEAPGKTVALQRGVAGNIGEQLLQDSNAFVARDIAKKLYKMVPAKFRPKPATVRAVRGEQIYLRVPRARVRENGFFDIYALESLDDEEDSDGGAEDVIETFIGRVQVVRIGDNLSTCRLLTPGAKIKKGMVAYPSGNADARGAAAAPAATPGPKPQPMDAGAPF